MGFINFTVKCVYILTDPGLWSWFASWHILPLTPVFSSSSSLAMFMTCSRLPCSLTPWSKCHLCWNQLQCSVFADIQGAWTQTGMLFDLLNCCLYTIPSCSRFHPSPSDLRHGHRLHLFVLEHCLRREGSLHAVRQRGLQASVCQHRHCAQVISLHPVHHHMAVFEKELQEIHQEQRGLPHTHRTLFLQRDSGQFGQGDHPEPSQQDKVHIQPGGPWDVWQRGVCFIVAVCSGAADCSWGC